MLNSIPEDFDLNKLHELYFTAIAQALGIPERYLWNDEQIQEHNDAILEKLWAAFADTPIGEHGDAIEEAFMHFPAGTDRFEIWHWFDEKHSKGLNWLMYGEEKKRGE